MHLGNMTLSFHSLSFLYLISLLHFLSFSYPTISAIASNNQTDILSLLDFKSKITNDPFRVMSSWNDSLHFCQWFGIQCGHKHRRVTAIRLQSLKLSGTISPHVGNLSFLRVLDLANNTFTNHIPSQIGHLHRLQELYLSNNSITGRIPTTILNCSNLKLIEFSFNDFNGEIPTQIGSLMKLKGLVLAFNRLVGNIPPSLGNLSSLEHLLLCKNNLNGIIPESLGQLINLRLLIMYFNSFSGEFPSTISNLSLVQAIDLADNRLTGNLPQGLGVSLPNLQFFSVSENQIGGTIPTSFSNATNLEALQLVFNNFTGTVPSLSKLKSLQLFLVGANYLGTGGKIDDLEFVCSLTNATNFQHFGIGSNNFGGKFRQCISNFSENLVSFEVHYNQIFGNIPDDIGALVNLEVFHVNSNKLSGLVPSSVGKLQNLRVFFLNSNHLSGAIPTTLGNITTLIKMDFSENNFQGNIPPTLGSLKNFLRVRLSRNNLSGAIPPQLFEMSSLSILLDLSENHLSGSIPVEVGNLKNLGKLNLGGNQLSGEIPTSLGSCTSLEFLYIGFNKFQGNVPSSLGSLRAIQELNFSHNNFSGEIPEFFKSFELVQLLDLSYNDFEGFVPIDGVFKNATAISVAGNENLCGGIPELKLNRCKFEQSEKKWTAKLKIILCVSLAFVAISTSLITSVFLWLSKKTREESASKWDGNSLLNISYRRLLEATDGFSANNLIGAGNFGTVYKGTIGQQQTVAVKVLNLIKPRASKSFTTECNALKNIRHRNLVKMLTVCSSADYGGKDFKALVYEFMVNGSLDDWLHPVEIDRSPRTLNFLQRLNIAIDVASALEYLHHHCEQPILHCDLKPSNILLDGEMTARVSDFGLAKFLSDQNVGSANESSSIGVRGTIGYCPPEYGMGSKVSAQGDIFSYGIILLEIFSGKRPTDEMFNDGRTLSGFVKSFLPDSAMEIVDPNIFQADGTQRFKKIKRNDNALKESLISIFETGIRCCAELPQERMGIANVVAQLCSVRNKLRQVNIN